jgi:hypothetical protein
VDSIVMPASENLVWGLSVSSRECRCCRVILSRHQIAFAARAACLLGCKVIRHCSRHCGSLLWGPLLSPT